MYPALKHGFMKMLSSFVMMSSSGSVLLGNRQKAISECLMVFLASSDHYLKNRIYIIIASLNNK